MVCCTHYFELFCFELTRSELYHPPEPEVTKPSTSQPRKPSSSNKTAASKGGQKGRAPSQPIAVDEEDVFGGPAKNARLAVNGKGKGKVPAQPPKAQPPVEEEEQGEDVEVEEETVPASAARGNAKSNGARTKAPPPADDEEEGEFSGRSAQSLIREINLLRKQKERLAESHERELDKLQKQNETLLADNEAVSPHYIAYPVINILTH